MELRMKTWGQATKALVPAYPRPRLATFPRLLYFSVPVFLNHKVDMMKYLSHQAVKLTEVSYM